MTSISHLYRDLGTPHREAFSPDLIAEDEVEDIQLASFDSGYKAGWDDALKVRENDAGQVGAELAQNLQDMAFTHHEAYLKFSTAMKPLFSQILETLLPSAARQMLGLHILEQFDTLMDDHVKSALEIAVSPDNINPLRDALDDMAPVPFSLIADPSLADGQAQLRVGREEREINLNAVLSGVSEAIDAFFDQLETEKPHD
jgi:flagellar assembly protein FliH